MVKRHGCAPGTPPGCAVSRERGARVRPEPTPEQLAVTTPWTAADWQDCYNAWSWRPEWPQLAAWAATYGPHWWRQVDRALDPVDSPIRLLRAAPAPWWLRVFNRLMARVLR